MNITGYYREERRRSPQGPKKFPKPEKAMAFIQIGDLKIEIVRSDLCNETTDAIVNAANSHLIHAGGLAKAIVINGGKRIQLESDAYVEQHGSVETGSCCITGSGRLPCKFVIHAVGPIWYTQRDKTQARKLLRKTIRSIYIKAIKKNLQSLSIPPVSGGIFGYPTELCAYDIVTELFRVAKIHTGTLKLLRIVIIDIPTFQVFFRRFIRSRRDYLKEMNPNSSNLSAESDQGHSTSFSGSEGEEGNSQGSKDEGESEQGDKNGETKPGSHGEMLKKRSPIVNCDSEEENDCNEPSNIKNTKTNDDRKKPGIVKP